MNDSYAQARPRDRVAKAKLSQSRVHMQRKEISKNAKTHLVDLFRQRPHTR